MENTQKRRILIIEDERNIVQLLSYNLAKAGYEYDVAYDGEEGLRKALESDFDLILLDIMLPKMDGYTVCKMIRQTKDTPIIMATAKEEEIDKIRGLNIGADDYVTKPFSLAVLLARINSNIRRSSGSVISGSAAAKKKINVRELEIDLERAQVLKNGEIVKLSKKEYELVKFFGENLGKIFSREDLLTKVWGYDGFFGDKRTVDVTISRLRQKLESDAENPEYIITKSGMGYYMN